MRKILVRVIRKTNHHYCYLTVVVVAAVLVASVAFEFVEISLESNSMPVFVRFSS